MKTLISLIMALLPIRSEAFTITEIHETEPHIWYVEVQNPSGHVFSYYAEDWCDVYEGEIVSAVMYTHGTKDIRDDEILSLNTSWYYIPELLNFHD